MRVSFPWLTSVVLAGGCLTALLVADTWATCPNTKHKAINCPVATKKCSDGGSVACAEREESVAIIDDFGCEPSPGERCADLTDDNGFVSKKCTNNFACKLTGNPPTCVQDALTALQPSYYQAKTTRQCAN